MSAILLDANVLIALVWPTHEAHLVVERWFAKNTNRGWATCPLTQAAFVRILSNPAFSRDAVSPQQAVKVLESNLKHRFHQFWADDIGFAAAIEPFRQRLVGHRQVTDVYLLGLAVHYKGWLATLDQGLPALVPEDGSYRSRIEVIRF